MRASVPSVVSAVVLAASVTSARIIYEDLSMSGCGVNGFSITLTDDDAESLFQSAQAGQNDFFSSLPNVFSKLLALDGVEGSTSVVGLPTMVGNEELGDAEAEYDEVVWDSLGREDELWNTDDASYDNLVWYKDLEPAYHVPYTGLDDMDCEEVVGLGWVCAEGAGLMQPSETEIFRTEDDNKWSLLSILWGDGALLGPNARDTMVSGLEEMDSAAGDEGWLLRHEDLANKHDDVVQWHDRKVGQEQYVRSLTAWNVLVYIFAGIGVAGSLAFCAAVLVGKMQCREQRAHDDACEPLLRQHSDSILALKVLEVETCEDPKAALKV